MNNEHPNQDAQFQMKALGWDSTSYIMILMVMIAFYEKSPGIFHIFVTYKLYLLGLLVGVSWYIYIYEYTFISHRPTTFPTKPWVN